MRLLIFAMLLLVAAACKTNNDPQKVMPFLESWAKSIATGSIDSVRKYYDPSFVLPKVMFELPEGVSYHINMSDVEFQITTVDSILVVIPFEITNSDGVQNSTTISLTISRSKSGNLFITKMSEELAVGLKETAMSMEQHQPETPKAGLSDEDRKAMIDSLSSKYDKVVYYAGVDDLHLFYVVNGTWENPYAYNKERDKGDFKIGVVNSDNKVIIPVEFDKIYNPNGTFDGMIEVEKDGMRGLYGNQGEAFLSCEYDGIYPVNITDAFAVVEKEGRFGWVNDKGIANFDPSSHANKDLFRSPFVNNSIIDWQFSYPGSITVLEQLDENDGGAGLIIYPSYLRDLGITPIANNSVLIGQSEYGMGMEENQVKVEMVESISDKFFALIGYFMESGADARGYQTARNDVFVVDRDGATLSTLKGLIESNGQQDPCDGAMSYKSIEPGFYETSNGSGVYTYYKVNEEGTVKALETVRQYNFTKFVKIDESYFTQCRYDNVEYDGEGGPNIVIIRGYSSEDLDIMRNEIYAEYGLIFKSEKWKNYFEEQFWYKPEFENVDQQLSETDKHNIKFIREYQQKHKDMEVVRDSIQYGWAG